MRSNHLALVEVGYLGSYSMNQCVAMNTDNESVICHYLLQWSLRSILVWWNGHHIFVKKYVNICMLNKFNVRKKGTQSIRFRLYLAEGKVKIWTSHFENLLIDGILHHYKLWYIQHLHVRQWRCPSKKKHLTT